MAATGRGNGVGGREVASQVCATEAEVERIVERVRRGQTDAFAEIVGRYQDEVWRIAVRLLTDRDATRDLVQQVFVDAYHHLDQYRPGTDFGAWLRTIARNLARREIRAMVRSSRRMEAYRRLLLVRLRDDRAFEDREQALYEALRECRGQLSGRDARILELRYARCMAFDAIAAEVGGTAGGMQRLISRIRLRLRDCIQEKVATE
jgi:RNA polymerase sigma-70 factor (ECF subfamily)